MMFLIKEKHTKKLNKLLIKKNIYVNKLLKTFLFFKRVKGKHVSRVRHCLSNFNRRFFSLRVIKRS